MTGISLGALAADDHNAARAIALGWDMEDDSMRNGMIEPIRDVTAPPIAARIGRLSDDECVRRLADAVEAHDAEHLDELAQLLGRLAVVIE
jgi:hypothetical protein